MAYSMMAESVVRLGCVSRATTAACFELGCIAMNDGRCPLGLRWVFMPDRGFALASPVIHHRAAPPEPREADRRWRGRGRSLRLEPTRVSARIAHGNIQGAYERNG
jgi:hypothetical protein